MKRSIKQTILAVFVALAMFMAIPMLAAAHSGRTDANGGHHDYKNVSGLGPYHYHHGYGPHLHPGGVCPYDSSSSTKTTTPAKPKIDYKVKVNGSEISFGQAPYEKDDYVYVPLRPICNALDASTVWDEETKTVTMDKGEKRVVCKLYSDTATVDDSEVNIKPTIIQKNSSTMVPLRFFEQTFGLVVDYDSSTHTISITD